MMGILHSQVGQRAGHHGPGVGHVLGHLGRLCQQLHGMGQGPGRIPSQFIRKARALLLTHHSTSTTGDVPSPQRFCASPAALWRLLRL